MIPKSLFKGNGYNYNVQRKETELNTGVPLYLPSRQAGFITTTLRGSSDSRAFGKPGYF